MRRLALTIALACVLSGVIRAGEIHTTGAIASPTPSPVPAMAETHNTGAAAAGAIPSTDGTAHEESTTVLTIVLTIISIIF